MTRSVEEILAEADNHQSDSKPSKASKADLFYEPGKKRSSKDILNEIDNHNAEAPTKLPKREWYQDSLDQAGALAKDLYDTGTGAAGEALQNPGAAIGAAGMGLYAGYGGVADATANIFKQVAPAARLIPGVAMGEQWLKDVNQLAGRPAEAPAMIAPAIKESAPYQAAAATAPHSAHGGELLGMFGVGSRLMPGNPAAAVTQPGLAAVQIPGKLIQKMLPGKAGPITGRIGQAAGGAVSGLGFGTAAGVNQQIQEGKPVDVGAALGGSQGLGLVGGVLHALPAPKGKGGKGAPKVEQPKSRAGDDPQSILRDYYRDPGKVSGDDVAWAQRQLEKKVPLKSPDASKVQSRTGTGNQLPILAPRENNRVRAPERGKGVAKRPPEDDIIDVEYEPTVTPEERRLPDKSQEPITPPSPRERGEAEARQAEIDKKIKHPDARGEEQASPEYFVDKIRKANDPGVLDQIIRDPEAPPEFIEAAMNRWEEISKKPKAQPEQKPVEQSEPAEKSKGNRQLTIDEWSDRYAKEDTQFPESKKRFAGEPNTVFTRKGKQVNTAKTEASWSPRDMSDAELEKASDYYETEQKRKGVTSHQRRKVNEEQKAITQEKMRREMRRAEGLPQDGEPITYREEPPETQNPQLQAEGGNVQPTESFETEPKSFKAPGDVEASGTAKENTLRDRIRQLHEEYSTSDQIARVLRRENPEMVSQFGTLRELTEHVRENRLPEVSDYLEGIKDNRNPNIKRVDPPEGTPEAPSSLGHLSDGNEYFVRKAANGDRQVWSAKTGAAGEGAIHAGSFKEIRNAYPELFEKRSKDSGRIEKIADAIRDQVEKRGRGRVKEFLEGEEGHGSAIPFLDEAAAEKVMQNTLGFSKRVHDVIRRAKDPATRAKWWDAAESVAQVTYDVDKLRRFDHHGLFQDFNRLQGELDRLLRGVEIPKTAETKLALAKAGKLSPAEVMEMKELNDKQKMFAIELKMETEAFQERVKDRYKELSTELEDNDPYMQFLRDYYEHISGKNIETGRLVERNDAGLNAVKDYWYDAVVTGNWHIHSIHLFDALIQGFGALGLDAYKGGMAALSRNSALGEFVRSHQGSGLMKAARFGDEVSLKDKIDAKVERGISKLPLGKGALWLARKAEGSWAENLKIESLRAGVMIKIAKEMKYEGGAEQLAKDIMNGSLDKATVSEVYTRMASDLFDMIGYQAIGVKNRNIWQRGEFDLPSGKTIGGAGNSAFSKMLQPFMGMRTVQSRLAWKMWGEVFRAETQEARMKALVPVLRLHAALAIHGGAATLPRAAQMAIYYTLGASALNQITKELNKIPSIPHKLSGGLIPEVPWSVGHVTPDAFPALMATWDNIGRLVSEAGENMDTLRDGKLEDKLGIALGAVPSIAGAPSGKSIAMAAKNFIPAYGVKNKETGEVEHNKVTGVYEDLLHKREKRRGVIKDQSYDWFKALFDTFMPTHSRKELHHDIQDRLNKSRFLDWVKTAHGSDTRKQVAEWFKSVEHQEDIDWFEWRDKVNELAAQSES